MTDTTSKDDEPREQLLEHFIDGAPSYDTANEYQQALARLKADAILPLIKQYGIQERNKGHWYAGGYGKDANGFEIGYKCNCGFTAQNKSTIHSHVDWKKAELTALKDKES